MPSTVKPPAGEHAGRHFRRRIERQLRKSVDVTSLKRWMAAELYGLVAAGDTVPTGDQVTHVLQAVQRITAGPRPDEELPTGAHRWVVAANVNVSERIAAHAELRRSFRSPEGLRIDALEVACKACRRPYDEVADEDCVAIDEKGREHLRGGPIGERAKRKVVEWDRSKGVRVQAPTIQRRGVAAVVSREA